MTPTAHEGQADKGGTPYIPYPLNVMLRVNTLEERIVAVLHDVVEDCGISLDDLRKEGFSEAVLTAIESVTNVPGESYETFVERAAQNPIGRVVKLADLEENSDLSRIAQPSWEDLERVEKYRRAIGVLRS
ncbi:MULTISPECIES: HD domain-containing protein [unclassified Pseudomonas]|uniref:HD domain-containing protein n=1 Tax=unclassified Pseudomonas TaxID=196821 RepID=UPI000DAED721|nr:MULTISPECIES: HD domain-containing protein [unclassified Pseudomonas]